MIFSKKQFFFIILLVFLAFIPNNNFLLAQVGIPCAACLEEFNVGDQVCTLPCKHTFHKDCIIHWFKEPLAGAETPFRDPDSGEEIILRDVPRYHDGCPMCREQLPQNLHRTIMIGEIPRSMMRIVEPSPASGAASIIAAPVIIQDETEGASSLAGGASAALPEFLTLASNPLYPNEPMARSSFESKLEAAMRDGVDINIQDPRNGNTALHWAVINEKAWMAQILIRNGASMEPLNHCGETPLDLILSMPFSVEKQREIEALQKAFKLRD